MPQVQELAEIGYLPFSLFVEAPRIYFTHYRGMCQVSLNNLASAHKGISETTKRDHEARLERERALGFAEGVGDGVPLLEAIIGATAAAGIASLLTFLFSR